MSLVTISRGSYSKGKEVAEKVAERLGYECVSRDVLLEASEEFNVPEFKLVRAIHDAPRIFDQFSLRRGKYIAYIQAALLSHMKKDNVVYHGLAGHFFVRDVPHALKVRIIADMKDRVKAEMAREKIDEKEALQILQKDDQERAEWSRHLYGVDTRDPSLYDLTIHIHRITVNHAVDLICNTVKLPEFQATPESQKTMNDLILAAEVKSKLMQGGYFANVRTKGGAVVVTLQTHLAHEAIVTEKIQGLLEGFPGIESVDVMIKPILPLTE